MKNKVNTLKASGLNKGLYCSWLDSYFKERTPQQIKQFMEEEKLIIRHSHVSNNNVVGVAKTEKEVDEVIKYARRYPNTNFETLKKVFKNINWQY